MKSFVFLSLLLAVFNAEAWVVTSLNIKWFGRGGEIDGVETDEYRLHRLKDFIFKELPKSDVYVFQEITHKKMLYDLMVGYNCISYDASSLKHQFIVMCAAPGDLKNYKIIHDVRLQRNGLRSAIIANYQKESESIRVVGLHLKAGKSSSFLRLEQIAALKPHLYTHRTEPTLLIGDFNTFSSERTNIGKNDEVLISETLGLDFKEVPNEVYTYMGFGGRIFDRAWVNAGSMAKSLSVFGPCKKDSVEFPYSKSSFYRRFVSDHCAVSVEVN